MVGTSSGTAPYSRSRSDTTDACSLVLGTSTRQPNSGLVSYQDILLFAAAASPTTAARARSPRRPNSGLVSYQDILLFAAAASPTTATAVPRVVATVTPAALRSGPIRPGVGV